MAKKEDRTAPLMQIQVIVNEKLYLKDPDSTKLGRSIIFEGVQLIDKIGFEELTFKKLAIEMGSTEASIYRYFENKHQLLVYLISWYWSWLQYKLTLVVFNLDDPAEKLRVAIKIFTHSYGEIPAQTPMDLDALYRIVISESPKAYLTKEVDVVNKEGAYLNYKRFTRQVAELLSKLNPEYAYPRALISTAIESAHDQKYFSEHLPRLTEVSKGKKGEVCNFLTEMIFKTIGV
ncbi:MAG: TetR/AcrR family transcriptional regulator [Bacteroidia bacterium]